MNLSERLFDKYIAFVQHRFVIPAPICNLSCTNLQSLPRYGVSLPQFEIPAPTWKSLSSPYL